MNTQLLVGDCREQLANIPNDSIDAIVTDPPYELGFMGKAWDASGIAYNVEVWRECLRALKPGGHLLAFSGSRTYHRMACAIEDAGFEIRDQIMWVYGSGFPKSHNLKGERQGWGTALKPAHEPICMARKPFKGTVAENVLAHGTGAINVDGCRVGTEDDLSNHVTNSKAPSVFIAGGTIRTETHPQGRWPANLIHDGSEEVLTGFPVTDKAPAPRDGGFREDGAQRGNVDFKSGCRPTLPVVRGDTGSAARFFYCAKASKRDRDEGCGGLEARQPTHGKGHEKGGLNVSDSKNPQRNHHPTVKPTDLMRYLCRLVTPPGGTVLDPFTGSGSTGKAAMLEGFDFIGIEMSPEYAEIAQARINFAKGIF
jgi:hypothetical protein